MSQDQIHNQDVPDGIVRAAANVLAGAALQLIQDDPHQWSERSCQTCRAVGSIIGKPFGCYVYAQQRAEQRAEQRARAQQPIGKGQGLG